MADRSSKTALIDELGDDVNVGNPLPVECLTGLVPEQYDEIDLSYTGTDLTGVVYSLAGDVIATLTLAYTGGNLTNVTRT